MMISVTISPSAANCAAQWDDLARRASPNVFMDPAALEAARVNGFADVQVLSAWEPDGGVTRLVGLWALRIRRIAPVWPALLDALPYEYAFLSNPVVDPSCIDAVFPAFLVALAACRTFPRVISLKSLDVETPAFAALQRAVIQQGGSLRLISKDARPIVTRIPRVKPGSSTRKKMRQDWNRLSALGTTEVVNSRRAEEVCEAFETFLRLEQAGWKGKAGTALLCNASDCAFARELIRGLAERSKASVALLQVDGKAIAAQVLMYCDTTAYTWKTAYDSAYARYSPGVLLVDKITDQIFAAGDILTIDSCAVESSFMAQVWPGRRAMADVLVELQAHSLPFRLELARLRGIAAMKRTRNRIRSYRNRRAKAPR